MTDTAKLSLAIAMAAEAHANQTDKIGQPYILHPLRVMMAMSNVDEQIVAVMHDTVEDTDITLERILNLFGYRIAAAVDALTKRADETYMDFIDRCAADPIARKVKLADIADNMAPDRLSKLSLNEHARLKDKYVRASKRLMQ